MNPRTYVETKFQQLYRKMNMQPPECIPQGTRSNVSLCPVAQLVWGLLSEGKGDDVEILETQISIWTKDEYAGILAEKMAETFGTTVLENGGHHAIVENPKELHDFIVNVDAREYPDLIS